MFGGASLPNQAEWWPLLTMKLLELQHLHQHLKPKKLPGVSHRFLRGRQIRSIGFGVFITKNNGKKFSECSISWTCRYKDLTHILQSHHRFIDRADVSRSFSPHLQGEDGQGSLLFQHSLVEATLKQTGKWRELLPSRSKDSQKMNWKVDPSLIAGLTHAKRLLWPQTKINWVHPWRFTFWTWTWCIYTHQSLV